MQRRSFLKFSLSTAPLLASGCALWRVDEFNVLLRSDIIDTPEKEREVLSRARTGWTDDGRVRVLYVQGTPYERGYQHGALLRREVQSNIGYLYRRALSAIPLKEMFAESYERMRPYISQEYIDEMHGLAHGAKVPLEMIHHIHVLPSIGEWSGKKKIKQVVKAMIRGELPSTSCSNFCLGSSSPEGFFAIRILDWGMHRISKLHKYPLILVARPDKGVPYANIGWVGFLGAISGLNSQGISLGEMGYGDPPNETLRGQPMPFLLRDVLSYAQNLGDVRRVIRDAPGENSYVFLMSDGKAREAEMYIKDMNRFLVYTKGQSVSDGNNKITPIGDMVYGGHYLDRMSSLLSEHTTDMSIDLLQKKIIPEMSMPSNFQNVIYDSANLRFWVNNAKSPEERAAEQPYSYFDLRQALEQWPGSAEKR